MVICILYQNAKCNQNNYNKKTEFNISEIVCRIFAIIKTMFVCETISGENTIYKKFFRRLCLNNANLTRTKRPKH